MMVRKGLWGLFMLWALLPGTTGGQEVTWRSHGPSGGWIGVTVDFTSITAGEREEALAVIMDVVDGSPAEMAGIQAGDTITHMDGRPISQRIFAALPETLQPGDLVRVTVVRDGRPREILVEAGERPASSIVVRPDRDRMVVELEALSGDILRNLDSLRLSFAGVSLDSLSGDLTFHVLRVPRGTAEEGRFGFSFRMGEPFGDTLSFEPDVFLLSPEVAVPFETMIVESRATATLREELQRVRKELTQVRREELSRRRELSASVRGSLEEVLRQDERTRELRAREDELLAEQEALLGRLRQVSEEELQRQWMEVQTRSEEAMRKAQRAQREEMEGSLREIYEESRELSRSPLLVGQTFILGAQLSPLNPQLAEYFQVDEGVLVFDVVDDTPAAEAGLRGGDVIVAVAGEGVRSISDLRFGVGIQEGPLRIRVVRKGEPVEIVINR